MFVQRAKLNQGLDDNGSMRQSIITVTLVRVALNNALRAWSVRVNTMGFCLFLITVWIPIFVLFLLGEQLMISLYFHGLDLWRHLSFQGLSGDNTAIAWYLLLRLTIVYVTTELVVWLRKGSFRNLCSGIRNHQNCETIRWLKKRIERQQSQRFQEWKAKRQGVEFLYPINGFANLKGVETLKREVFKSTVLAFAEVENTRKVKIPVPRSVLITGPHGSGKRSLAEGIIAEIQVRRDPLQVYRCFGTEFLQNAGGLLEIASLHSPCVVLVDRLDKGWSDSPALNCSRAVCNRPPSNSGKDICNSVSSLRRGDVLLIVTAIDYTDAIDRLLSEGEIFDHVFPLALPTKLARAHILQHYLELYNCEMSGIDVDTVASLTDGWSPKQLRNLVGFIYPHAVDKCLTGNKRWHELSTASIDRLIASGKEVTMLEARKALKLFSPSGKIYECISDTETEVADVIQSIPLQEKQAHEAIKTVSSTLKYEPVDLQKNHERLERNENSIWTDSSQNRSSQRLGLCCTQ